MVSRKRKIFIHNFEMMASIGVYENERKNIGKCLRKEIEQKYNADI